MTERTIKLATIVDTVEDAFAFVFDHMHAEGMIRPQILISPITMFIDPSVNGMESTERYEVSVSGMSEHNEE